MPAEPRYVVLRLRRPGAWAFARGAVLLAVAAQLGLLLARPALGLDLLWGIVVPLLPVVWLLAPGVWRNVCPMATANQLPRWLGISRARRLPRWLDRHGYGIGLALFLVAVGLRPVALHDGGTAAAALLAGLLGAALLGGLLFAGKSGFCGSVCPLRPSQDLLSRAPVLRAAHAHCAPCVGCSSSCQDVKPETALLETLHGDDPVRAAYRRIFAGALPAVTIALFTAAPVAQTGAGAYAVRMAVAALAGAGLLVVVEALAGLTPGRVVALFSAAAFVAFAAFNAAVFADTAGGLAGVDVPGWAVWEARAVLLVVALRWLRRTWAESGARERELTGAKPAPPVVAPDAADRRRPAPAPEPARPAAAPVVVGTPPVVIPDRRAPERPMRPPVVTLWPGGEQIEVEVGTTVSAAARAAGHPLPEGCGTGLCGCDPVRIRAGGGNLAAPGSDEAATLERLGLPEGTRLACATRVLGDVAVDLEQETVSSGTPDVRIGDSVERVIVVGNGVAGVTAASHLRRLSPTTEITLLSDSLRPFYNRIAVSRLIHEAVAPELSLMPQHWYDQQRISQWLGSPVARLDLAGHHVVLDGGQALPYDRLILATGARSLMPALPGIDLPGVFGLRTADDATAIRAYVEDQRPRRAVVLGGGVLGVEAADALSKFGVHTTVVERSPWLSSAEVDRRAGTLLRNVLVRRGVSVTLATAATGIAGEDRPTGVELADGTHVDAELVVVCAGITPNAELARSCGLQVGRGVLVDGRMQTSDASVLACGDVAEHPDGASGRWPIAVEQATVAAVRALGGDRPYAPGPVPTKLKISGISLRVVGVKEAGEGQHEIAREDRVAGTYRKLVVDDDGRLVGALAFGAADDWDDVVLAVREGREAAPVARAMQRSGSGPGSAQLTG